MAPSGDLIVGRDNSRSEMCPHLSVRVFKTLNDFRSFHVQTEVSVPECRGETVAVRNEKGQDRVHESTRHCVESRKVLRVQ